VLTRSIARDDPFAPTIEETIFHIAKYLCATFAVATLAFSGLYLMNLRPPADAAAFASQPSVSVAIPGAALTTLSARASYGDAAGEPFAVVAIDFKAGKKIDNFARKKPVVDTASANAATVSPPAFKPAALADLAQQAQEMARQGRDSVRAELPYAPAPPDGTMQLASLAPQALPEADLSAPAIKVALPDTIAVLPPRAPGALPPPPSPAQRLKLAGKVRAEAERCLAKAVYFEARDESFTGQVAVAQVVMNRVFSPFYPHDVCDVIYQNADRHRHCQFSFACDGKPEQVDEADAWERAEHIAQLTLDGQLYVQAVGTATHYHAAYAHPAWVGEMRRITREGGHLFYRPRAWGSGADEPIWSSKKLAARSHMAANGETR
jgi:hypothetical protein